MKVHVEIDCTPEEARTFMGLPDVSKANSVYVDTMAKAMKGVTNPDQLQDIAKTMAPMGQMGLKMFQNFVEGSMAARDVSAPQGEKKGDDVAPWRQVFTDTFCLVERSARCQSVIRPGSGPATRCSLAGRLPLARRTSLAKLHDASGGLLDEALILWFPGPATATGEDCAEIHCHGGRAVIAAIGRALAAIPGLRAAEAGEFTRRAFANGRLDLAEAEGLADLLSAETELQRAVAASTAEGGLSRQFGDWRERLLVLSAQIESALDFSDEDDVPDLPDSFLPAYRLLAQEFDEVLARPGLERLKDGIRVVLAGPPNAGKSTLFNAILQSEAAIALLAGTTRDVIERPVAIAGVPFVFIDTAGLRDHTADAIEQIGMDRAAGEVTRADIVLWLGQQGDGPAGAWEIETRADESGSVKDAPRHRVSGKTGEGLEGLTEDLARTAASKLPKPGAGAVNQRQRELLAMARSALGDAPHPDLLLAAEQLRQARSAFDRILGNAATEDMLDTLFGRFCIGK